MYNVSINLCGTGDVRMVTIAEASKKPLTVEAHQVPNGDGGMWWELAEGERVKLAEWLGVDHLSPAACHDWALDLEVQIVERIAAN